MQKSQLTNAIVISNTKVICDKSNSCDKWNSYFWQVCWKAIT